MQDSEPEPSPCRLRILIANDPLAYRDVLGNALNILRPECEVRVLRDDLLTEMDRYRPNILVQNAGTVLLNISLYPRMSTPGPPSGKSAEGISEPTDFSGLLQVVDRVLQAMFPWPSANAGGVIRVETKVFTSCSYTCNQ